MRIWREGMAHWTYIVGAALLAIGMLIWLEWLGSERPVTRAEVPVRLPSER
jgi:hypothetical protein